MTVTVTLQYFDGCPNWEQTLALLQAIASDDGDVTLETERIATQDRAEARGFRGSPTVLVDGVDPFAEPDAPIGLACRVYRTPDGYAGAPTAGQLRAALAAARRGR